MAEESLQTSPISRLAQDRTAPTDARLVELARRGAQDAFAALVQRYQRGLLRVIGRFIRDADLVEDLAQETFLRVHQRLDQFDPSRRFGPWLFRIGVNLALDHHRRRKRRVWGWLFSERAAETTFDPAQSDPREALDVRQEVQAVLERISEKYRVVLILRELENFSTSEIAAILDRREATIRWRLAEGRKQFQELWSVRMNCSGAPLMRRASADEEATS